MDLTPFIDALADAVAARLPAPIPTIQDKSLDLWRAYTPTEAAQMLGLNRNTIYELSAELGTVYVGPSRRSPRILGINILLYMAGLDPIDIEAVAREQRQAFLDRSPAPITPISGTKQRVL